MLAGGEGAGAAVDVGRGGIVTTVVGATVVVAFTVVVVTFTVVVVGRGRAKAFGFTVRLRIANHRIQMRAREGCFTIAEGNIVPNRSHITQVRIEDALAHCERARQHGAREDAA